MGPTWRALVPAALLLVACGSPSFTGNPDAGDDGAALADGGSSGDANAADAGGGPLLCPPTSCADHGEVCCIYRGSGDQFVGQCETTPKCGQGPVGTTGDTPDMLACTRSAQCTGTANVCCISQNNNAYQSSCVSAASCTASNGALLCEMSKPACPLGLAACGNAISASIGLPSDLGTCADRQPK